MEASKILGSSFRIAAWSARVCECPCAPSTRKPIALSICPRPLAHRSFSTSYKRRQDAKREPQDDASKPANSPLRSPPTPKQALRIYTTALQKIIDGYNLKSRLPPRQHESLVVALTNAEVRLDAPGAHADSFAPLLRTLRGEIEPVLKINLGSSDVDQLVADVGNQRTMSIPEQPPKDPIPAPRKDAPQPPRKSAQENILSRVNEIIGAPKPPPSSQKSPQQSISSRLDAVMGTQKPAPAPPIQASDDDDSTLSTLDKLWNLYAKQSAAERDAANIHGSDPFSPGESDDAKRQRRELSMSIQDRLNESDAAWAKRNRPTVRPALRLKPSLGRTVDVSGNFDVTRAFRSLEAACSRNNVKRDVQKQRFHVRRGQLKKHLKIERWRKLFKEGFLAECDRVRKMRKQGW